MGGCHVNVRVEYKHKCASRDKRIIAAFTIDDSENQSFADYHGERGEQCFILLMDSFPIYIHSHQEPMMRSTPFWQGVIGHHH